MRTSKSTSVFRLTFIFVLLFFLPGLCVAQRTSSYKAQKKIIDSLLRERMSFELGYGCFFTNLNNFNRLLDENKLLTAKQTALSATLKYSKFAVGNSLLSVSFSYASNQKHNDTCRNYATWSSFHLIYGYRLHAVKNLIFIPQFGYGIAFFKYQYGLLTNGTNLGSALQQMPTSLTLTNQQFSLLAGITIGFGKHDHVRIYAHYNIALSNNWNYAIGGPMTGPWLHNPVIVGVGLKIP